MFWIGLLKFCVYVFKMDFSCYSFLFSVFLSFFQYWYFLCHQSFFFSHLFPSVKFITCSWLVSPVPMCEHSSQFYLNFILALNHKPLLCFVLFSSIVSVSLSFILVFFLLLPCQHFGFINNFISQVLCVSSTLLGPI